MLGDILIVSALILMVFVAFRPKNSKRPPKRKK